MAGPAVLPQPRGSVPDPRDPSKRIYFSTFRPFFTQAGIEVVDCPSLARGAKNGADIRIVVDAMTALQSAVPFDELVIASSDADFTPLLQVVRASHRRITIIATSITAPAYESVADEVLDEEGVFALMAESPAETERAPDGTATDPTPLPAATPDSSRVCSGASSRRSGSTRTSDVSSPSGCTSSRRTTNRRHDRSA